jgi:xanthine dehydrogenase/oxidase
VYVHIKLIKFFCIPAVKILAVQLILVWCSIFQLAEACYMERVDLSAHGFYITPDIGFDWIAGKGSPFNYFTYGAAFAEVEIDTLTGDFHTRTADIVMDLGYSINPAIDIGQVCLQDMIE